MTDQSDDRAKPEGFYELRRIVAGNLRDNRIRHGWTLEQLATMLSPFLGLLRTSTISAWESARHDGHKKAFTVEELFAICKVFDLTIAELIGPPPISDVEPVIHVAGGLGPEEATEVFGVDGKNVWRGYLTYVLEKEVLRFEAISAEIQKMGIKTVDPISRSEHAEGDD